MSLSKSSELEYSRTITTHEWHRGLSEKFRIASTGVLLKNKGTEFDKVINVANTLLARDYKGFGNQSMNAVIENGQTN